MFRNLTNELKKKQNLQSNNSDRVMEQHHLVQGTERCQAKHDDHSW